jgi:hypothetical protein
MIDHVSVAVRDLINGEHFYAAVLAPLGLAKLREWPGATIGFGKKYPEFWINKRDAMARVAADMACTSVCARPTSRRSMRFTMPRSKPVVFQMARPACGRTITQHTMLPSSAIRTATASKR